MPEYSIVDIFNMAKATALPAYGSDEKLAELSESEVKLIHDRLMVLAENEEVFGALWEAREAIYEAVRAVKKWTKTDFKGAYAEGDDLDLHVIDAPDIMVSGTPLTVFEKSVSAGTAYYWSGPSDAKIQLNEDEAIVIVGWYDPVDSPKATRVKFELPKRDYVVKLPFRFTKDVPLVVHDPVIIKPKESFRIQVRYDSSGDDALMPVGVKILKAEKMTL